MAEKKFAGMPDVAPGQIACVVHSSGTIDVFVKRSHENSGSYSWVELETLTNPSIAFPGVGDRRPVVTITFRAAAIVGVVDEVESEPMVEIDPYTYRADPE